MLNWNVRGLNNSARRGVVKDLVFDTRCTVACLQETKIQHVDTAVVNETLGHQFIQNFVFLPAQQTRGGALLAVHQDFYKIIDSRVGTFSVSAKIEATTSLQEWWLTVVYGPQGDSEKLQFLQELRMIKQQIPEKWLVIGDFNMILSAEDKSNNNLNRRLMGEFRKLINDLELKELRLRGRKFTWSNDTTQTRIDRAFCTVEWDLMLPNCSLQAASSSVSDHCPLLLVGNSDVKKYRGLRFESFWPRIQGYMEVVMETWGRDIQVQNPFLRLHIKMERLGKALRKWSRSKIGNNRLLLCAAKQLVAILDVVQESRQLTELELALKRDLKAKILGMTAVEKLRVKQQSRLAHIKAAEAQAKIFHVHLNGRKRKNFIQTLEAEGRNIHLHEEKEEHIFQHFSKQFGLVPQRSHTLDWDTIQLNKLQENNLEDEFTEEEVWEVISTMASEKAPGPDGYIGMFFKTAWECVKQDVMTAINYFHQQHGQHFGQINKAHIVLIPKTAEAKCLNNYRPISLTHSVAKIISKLLANRLQPHLQQLVSRTQSAFIKHRSIQDNFMFTQNLVKNLHRAKKATIFLKLDIKKAFDSVRWDYLIEVLHQMGFGPRWREWITILLSTATTSVLLNGARGKWFRHRIGLRQGDPLSPLLFILAMEPLHRMFQVAEIQGHLTPIQHRSTRARLSLYADDVAIFLKPDGEEMKVISDILDDFGLASGLITNRTKSAIYPIQCNGLNLEEVVQNFQCPVKSFPCTYLGLPLHTRALRRVDVQPLIDKVASRLPTWKGRLLNKAGRLTLVNTVLSAIPTYFLTVFAPKKWTIKQIDKIRRNFLWKGADEANGGHCLVRWINVMKPKKLGGLGPLNLEFFSRALRLRWVWYQWRELDRTSATSDAPVNEVDLQLFRVSTVVTIGNGHTAQFWNSSWLDGKAPRDIAPNLYNLAWRKNKTVHEEIIEHNWTRGLWRMNSVTEMAEFLLLWDSVQNITLNDQPDAITWRWSANGEYSAKTAYLAQFRGSYCTFQPAAIWRAQTEGKHRFFTWLLLQQRILTADRLLARNWPCNPVCPLCQVELETATHLCLQCPFALQVWRKVSDWASGMVTVPLAGSELQTWWCSSINAAAKEKRRATAAVLIYTAWNLWKERNRRIFDGIQCSELQVFFFIKEEIQLRQKACGTPSVD